jgi:ubiquinone/menaquinone biosynthesis C-methylase UbiE
MAVAETAVTSVAGGVRWGIDRSLSIAYGFVWDYIFEKFEPYQHLRREILELAEATVGEHLARRDVRILEIGCGPGNFTFTLAEAGFSVVGVDPYGPLIELAREKRRARRLSHLAFQQADLARGNGFLDASFDMVVSIHTLYVHPDPAKVLREAFRILKPGGQAVFVNHTRRVGLLRAFRDVKGAEGLGAALRALTWLLPNAVFETARKRVGPHYWTEDEFGTHLGEAGFTVLEMRRTFFHGVSLLAVARKDAVD